MKKVVVFCLLSVLPFALASIVLGETTLSVETAAIATGVENLTPIGVGEKFPATIGRVYCYSKILGGSEGNSVKHIWYYGDKKVSEMSLSVKYSSFRTYSYKTIPSNWTGKWRLEIVSDDGTILKTLEFNVE